VRFAGAVITAAYKAGRFVGDGQYRSVALLTLFHRASVHQTSSDTQIDRYPKIFDACRTYFANRHDLKILSYGCSTGEEVLTLRKYFPTAFITGAEINRRSLATCRRHEVDKRIAFVYSERSTIARRGPYDAIFCMAVFERTPRQIVERGIINLKRIYPFEKFERQLAELDEMLANGGLFVIRYAQYRFQDASLATKYVPLETAPPETDPVPKFDRNSHRLSEGIGTSVPSVYVKAVGSCLLRK
jgi:hypothetical protein